MVTAIPAVGVIVLLVLGAYLFLGAPIGQTRSMVVTLLNIVLFAVIVYLILGLFQVI